MRECDNSKIYISSTKIDETKTVINSSYRYSLQCSAQLRQSTVYYQRWVPVNHLYTVNRAFTKVPCVWGELLNVAAPLPGRPKFIKILRVHITVELQLSGLSGTASQPEMQKIRIIGFFFEDTLHRQFAVRLLLFTARTGI